MGILGRNSGGLFGRRRQRQSCDYRYAQSVDAQGRQEIQKQTQQKLKQQREELKKEPPLLEVNQQGPRTFMFACDSPLYLSYNGKSGRSVSWHKIDTNTVRSRMHGRYSIQKVRPDKSPVALWQVQIDPAFQGSFTFWQEGEQRTVDTTQAQADWQQLVEAAEHRKNMQEEVTKLRSDITSLRETLSGLQALLKESGIALPDIQQRAEALDRQLEEKQSRLDVLTSQEASASEGAVETEGSER